MNITSNCSLKQILYSTNFFCYFVNPLKCHNKKLNINVDFDANIPYKKFSDSAKLKIKTCVCLKFTFTFAVCIEILVCFNTARVDCLVSVLSDSFI